jgi:Cu/Ag efflux pump CusA
VLLGALFASTALTLFVVPCLYLTLNQAAERLGRRLLR